MTRALDWMIPPARAYIRYGPWPSIKRRLWSGLVGPYLAWRRHDFVARTRFGGRVAGHTQEILQQFIYYFGEWEPEISAWIARRLLPGDGFVDVGANAGYYSLLASHLTGPGGSVVAVEPSPAIFGELERNVALNEARNVRTVNVAASDHEGRVAMYQGPDSHTGLTSLVPTLGLPYACDVPATTIDNLLLPHEWARARIVKIDVEGAETAVIPGMSGLLEKGRADLEVILEVHVEALQKENVLVDDLLEPLFTRGFHLYRLDNDYSPLSYISADRSGRAARMRGPIDVEMNVVLSRVDADEI